MKQTPRWLSLFDRGLEGWFTPMAARSLANGGEKYVV
jgi:hypothetical protein